MSQEIDNKKVFSLLEVTRSIQKTLEKRYQSTFWVKTEMNKLNLYRHSGHCYPELVEKKEGKVVVEMKAILWRSDYQRINANFQQVLKEPLKDGIKILMAANIQFDPKYGLTLQIKDIDPSFTLGDLEKEKQESIQKLRTEGIFTKNKQLKLPLLPQRIAIISVETSKGYADFTNVFEAAAKTYNYAFFQYLFPSLLQGDNAVKTLVGQLRRIKKVKHRFDVVAIIRGGGGDIGLSCYNNYDLAREIAEFPIPVITGIGHSTNETVSEMIAHENAITPTKLAEFLIQKFHNFSVPVQKAEEKLVERSRRLILEKRNQFTSEVKLLRSVTRNILDRNKNNIGQHVRSVSQESRFRINFEKDHLNSTAEAIKRGTYQLCGGEKRNILLMKDNLKKEVGRQLVRKGLHIKSIERNLNNLSPQNVLKRGYSITQRNGKAISKSYTLNKGETLTTILYKGSVSSTVTSVNKLKNEG